MARWSDHSRTCSGQASADEVGLDSGITIGRGVAAASVRIVRSVNVFGTPVVPTRTVGRTAATTSSRLAGGSVLRPSSAATAAGSANERLFWSRSARPSWTSPCESTSTMARAMAAASSPASLNASAHSRAMPDTGGARADEDDRVSAMVAAVLAKRGQDHPRHDRRVPWMSSLKDGSRCAIAHRAAQARSLWKSSHCRMARGYTSRHAAHERLDELVVLARRAGAARDSRDTADPRAARRCPCRRRG